MRIIVYAAAISALLLLVYQLALLGRIDNGVTVFLLAPNVAVMIVGMRKFAT